MTRLDDDGIIVCLHCRRVKGEGELGWERHEISMSTLDLCPQHAAAFALGIDWGDRRNRIATTHAAPPASAEQRSPKDAANEQRERRAEARMKRVFAWDRTPQQVFDELSRWVAGQEAAKRTLATAVRTHYLRVQMRMIEESGKTPPVRPDLLPKESVLLLGPAGCGKSFTSRTLSKIVDVPFSQMAATNVSEVGYVGGDASDVLSYAISASDGHMGLAEKSIVFIDECDKKARRAVGNSSSYRDVSGEGVQTALLEMLDTGGSKIFVCPSVSGRRNPNQPLVEFDTRDIFFLLGGAFVGLADIIGRRIGGRKRMGFGCHDEDTPRDTQLREAAALHETLPEDLVEFGLIPELVGRCGSLAVFDPLGREDLRHIMLEVEDAVVKMQQTRAELEGFCLTFSDDAIAAICEQAYQSGMGARRLRSLTSEVLTRIFFEMPSQRRRKGTPRVIVTAATVADPTVYEVVSPKRTTAKVSVAEPIGVADDSCPQSDADASG